MPSLPDVLAARRATRHTEAMSEHEERKREMPRPSAIGKERPSRPANIPPPSERPPHISTQGYPPTRRD